jgi:predicted nucleotidyltransferase
VQETLSSHDGIVFAYVYGSFARGEPCRDLDVALYTAEAQDPFFALGLADVLTQRIGLEVDVTVLQNAPVALQFAVLRDGQLLFSKNEGLRTALIEKVGRRYWEYAHFRNLFLGVADAGSGQDR